MPIDGLAAFDIAMAAETKRVERRLRVTVRKLGAQVLRDVVLTTRVKSGRMRGNWQVTQNTPASDEVFGPFQKGGGATIAMGMDELQHVKAFGTIWISNNVPYIEIYEDKDHMADDAVTRAVAQFKGGGAFTVRRTD